jgi:hypothetical protein
MIIPRLKSIAKGLLLTGLFTGVGTLFLLTSTPTAATGLPTSRPQAGFAMFLPFVRLPEVNAPGSTPTATPQATATPAPPTADHMPYGPFHNSDFNRDFFDGAIIAGNAWNALPTIRSQGYRVFASTGDSNPCSYMPGGPETFDSEALLSAIVAKCPQILEYAADDTLLGLLMLNEPHDPKDCPDVPVYKLEQVAAGFWAAFPELSPADFYFGFGAPPTYYEDGGGIPSANLAFYQYSINDGPIEDNARPQQQSAARQGLKLIYSANLYYLGVAGTVAANIWECQQTDGVMVSLWTDRFIDDADASQFAAARSACEARAP